jgi:hypothetical protein
MNKHLIFSIYNRLRTDCGKIPTITVERLNKALGIALSSNYNRPYYTTVDTCTCPDAVKRTNIVCKHRLALMLKDPDTLLKRFNDEGPWDTIYR